PAGAIASPAAGGEGMNPVGLPGAGDRGGGSTGGVVMPVQTPAPIGLGMCAEVADNAGMVATLAGGPFGYLDGSFAEAQFRSPRGMAVDGEGRLYVADAGNRAVRRLDPDGT